MKYKPMLCALIVPLVGWTASAQTQPQGKPAQQPPTATPAKVSSGATKELPFCHKASDVIGSKVENPAGENLGKVEELVIDPQTGGIEYAVLSFGGFLGMGDKLFAIPFHLLKAPPVSEGSKLAHFTLDVDKAKLEKAPGFPKNNWPDIHAASWRSEIDKYFGVTRETAAEGAIEENKEFLLVKVSDLLGKDVYNTTDDDLGDIKEIVVDPQRSRLTYFVLSSGGFLGLGDKLFAIPWDELDIVRKENKLHTVLQIDKARLEKSPEFKEGDWVLMSDPTYVKQVYDYYHCPCYWVSNAPKGADGK